MTLLSLVLHLWPKNNTMLNYVDKTTNQMNSFHIEEGFLEWAVWYHETLPDFKKRPITTAVINFVSDTFQWSKAKSFVAVDFLFTFFNGILLYYLALLFKLSHREGLVTIAIFYLSFSILMAYFIPIATYDEPIQYFFILLSLFLLRSRKNALFLFAITMAILTRETTVILLPALYLTYSKGTGPKIKTIALFSAPVILYLVYLFIYHYNSPEAVESSINTLLTDRILLFKRNFLDLSVAIRSILSLLSVALLPIGVLLLIKQTKEDQNYMKGFWIAFVLNTLIVFAMSCAEESRLFLLPFLLIFPLLGQKVSAVFKKFNEIPPRYHLNNVLIALLTGLVGWFLLNKLYQFTDIAVEFTLYREYWAMSLALLSFIYLLKRQSSISKDAQA